MKLTHIIFILVVSFYFSGCYPKIPTYKQFERSRNVSIGYSFIPNMNKKFREVYSEDKYIYKFKGDDPRCVYAYLTNRDNQPEKVLSWFIISGEEFCKETPGVGEVI